MQHAKVGWYLLYRVKQAEIIWKLKLGIKNETPSTVLNQEALESNLLLALPSGIVSSDLKTQADTYLGPTWYFLKRRHFNGWSLGAETLSCQQFRKTWPFCLCHLWMDSGQLLNDVFYFPSLNCISMQGLQALASRRSDDHLSVSLSSGLAIIPG